MLAMQEIRDEAVARDDLLVKEGVLLLAARLVFFFAAGSARGSRRGSL